MAMSRFRSCFRQGNRRLIRLDVLGRPFVGFVLSFRYRRGLRLELVALIMWRVLIVLSVAVGRFPDRATFLIIATRFISIAA